MQPSSTTHPRISCSASRTSPRSSCCKATTSKQRASRSSSTRKGSTRCRPELKAILRNAAFAATAHQLNIAYDRYSKDFETIRKRGVQVLKTPDVVLDAQIAAWDKVIEGQEKDPKTGPFFKKVVEFSEGVGGPHGRIPERSTTPHSAALRQGLQALLRSAHLNATDSPRTTSARRPFSFGFREGARNQCTRFPVSSIASSILSSI